MPSSSTAFLPPEAAFPLAHLGAASEHSTPPDSPRHPPVIWLSKKIEASLFSASIGPGKPVNTAGDIYLADFLRYPALSYPTPLSEQLTQHNLANAIALIEAGADPMTVNDRDQTVLHLAVLHRGQDLKLIGWLVSRCPALVNRPDHHNQRPLHYAARQQNVYLCWKLLYLHADPTLKDFQGNTALNYAKIAANHETQKKLILLLENSETIYASKTAAQKALTARAQQHG
ncbi:ankyrin repeat domain-containing protein [Paraburkholderia bonniea]|uniref:ankyrin repeat domain-containing protein n=1 Tax=Paraburkholderia bonniea TaxID=2152891 RepID=UPI001580704D|nr:ankyrin repeat domain-containing protein [Paraburkholderia bonniea]WJF91617.1 ankyrin repeat domain-containing protein [Paraburkholderia bonniea]WJF94936.1 ankyrin repeat domain-containing protein [Paraburkholderia bonniea]